MWTMPSTGSRLRLGEEAVVRHAGDDRFRLHADACRSGTSRSLILISSRSAVVGPAFGLAAMFAQRDQLGLGCCPACPCEPLAQLTVNGQVGIAANRRGEVAIGRRWPGRSGLRRRGCTSPVSGCAAGRNGRRRRPGLPADCSRTRCRLKRSTGARQLVAEAAGEVGERFQLGRVGRGVDAAEEGHVLTVRGARRPPHWPPA